MTVACASVCMLCGQVCSLLLLFRQLPFLLCGFNHRVDVITNGSVFEVLFVLLSHESGPLVSHTHVVLYNDQEVHQICLLPVIYSSSTPYS